VRVRPSADDGAARCGRVEIRPLASSWRAGPSRVVLRNPVCPGRLQPKASASAETTASGCGRCRGEHEASRKNHRARNAGCARCFRGDLLVRLFLSRMRLRMHLASGVPCALAKEGSGLKVRARPRRHKNRADDARPQIGAGFMSANGASPARGAATRTGPMSHVHGNRRGFYRRERGRRRKTVCACLFTSPRKGVYARLRRATERSGARATASASG